MTDAFVIDSFAWIEYFLGSKKGERVKGFLEQGSCMTPTIVIAELSAKYSSEDKDFSERVKFIKFNTKVIQLNDEVAELAGKVKSQQKKIKKDFGLADSIVYATALFTDAKIITGDPHFENVKESIMI